MWNSPPRLKPMFSKKEFGILTRPGLHKAPRSPTPTSAPSPPAAPPAPASAPSSTSPTLNTSPTPSPPSPCKRSRVNGLGRRRANVYPSCVLGDLGGEGNHFLRKRIPANPCSTIAVSSQTMACCSVVKAVHRHFLTTPSTSPRAFISAIQPRRQPPRRQRPRTMIPAKLRPPKNRRRLRKRAILRPDCAASILLSRLLQPRRTRRSPGAACIFPQPLR